MIELLQKDDIIQTAFDDFSKYTIAILSNIKGGGGGKCFGQKWNVASMIV